MISQSKELLGSVIEIKLPGQFDFLFPLCFDELKRIEKKYSRFLDDSDLSEVNSKLNEWVSIDDEFLSLIQKALEFNKKTWGNFDITLKETLDQLGYDKDYSFEPKDKKNIPMAKKITSVLIQKKIIEPIKIDNKNKKILLRKQIDFGGFGKGYALDQLASLLNQNKCAHYYINAGGDIFAKKEEKEPPWIILLENPDNTKEMLGKIELDNKSIAASAPNRRKWKGMHHLISAKTKKPAFGTKGIFVIANSGIEADAYATALFSAGFDEAIDLSLRLPIDVLMISRENEMYQSPGFKIEAI